MSDKIKVLNVHDHSVGRLGIASVPWQKGRKRTLSRVCLPENWLMVIRQVHEGKRKIPAAIAAELAEHCGDDVLTDRELEGLRHLVDGKRNPDIAERLSIARETVKRHMRHILNKLGANDRTQALAIALRRGVIQL